MVFSEGTNFKICWLLHKDGSCPTLEHLLSLKSADKAFFASAGEVLARLKNGQHHKMPFTRSLKGKDAKGLLEARAMGGPKKQLARFPFFYSKEREVVLLYGFTKSDGTPPPKFVAKAKLYKELIEKGELQYEEANLSIFREPK